MERFSIIRLDNLNLMLTIKFLRILFGSLLICKFMGKYSLKILAQLSKTTISTVKNWLTAMMSVQPKRRYSKPKKFDNSQQPPKTAAQLKKTKTGMTDNYKTQSSSNIKAYSKKVAS